MSNKKLLPMEVGIYTFVEKTEHPQIEEKLAPVQRLNNLMEEIELTDETGPDVFGIGEHHRKEYFSSSPSSILSVAAHTQQIKLKALL